MSQTRTIIISAADTRFMPLLQAMLGSLAPSLPSEAFDLACFDLGLTDADRAWLAGIGCACISPGTHLGVSQEAHSAALRSFLARPFLREYFPGYDVYVWIDSDVWLQDSAVVQRYVDGALAHGMAITHEREPSYRVQLWLTGWTAKHMALGYPPFTAASLLTRRHLNAGMFAIRCDAPHWDAWAARYAAAIERTKALVPHDQFALNHAIYGDGFGGVPALDTAFLDPACNWICDRGIPMWSDASAAFCRPRAPFEPIGAMHLAGPAKRTVYDIKRTGGGSFRTYLLSGASPDSPVLSNALAGVEQARAA